MQKKELATCLNCRQYCDDRELDAFYECFRCRSVFLDKMKKLRNEGFGSIGEKEQSATEIKHDIDYITEVLEEFGISKGAAKLDTTEWILKAHLNKYGINIKDFSKKPRTTFEEVLSAMTDQELAKELKEMGVTNMRKKYKCDFYKLKGYLKNRLGKNLNKKEC